MTTSLLAWWAAHHDTVLIIWLIATTYLGIPAMVYLIVQNWQLKAQARP